jgi:hypothetical protein
MGLAAWGGHTKTPEAPDGVGVSSQGVDRA